MEKALCLDFAFGVFTLAIGMIRGSIPPCTTFGFLCRLGAFGLFKLGGLDLGLLRTFEKRAGGLVDKGGAKVEAKFCVVGLTVVVNTA